MMIVHSSRTERVGVDDVGERARRLADHVDLGVERAGARRELIFVLETRIETFEIGPVPKHVGLVLDGDAAGDAMLHEQSLADQLQHRIALPWRPPFRRKLGGEGFDRVEDGVDAPFVARQRHAFRQRVGDHQEPRLRKVLHRETPVWRASFHRLLTRFEHQSLVVAARGARHARADPLDDFVLLQWGEAKEDRDAET